MKKTILGVCGGNGVILHAFKEQLLANVEPRAIFHTKGDQQWNLNFDTPIQKSLNWLDESGVKCIVGAPDCGHSSVLSYSRAKKMGNAKDNKSLTMFFQAIHKFKPRIWLMENLPALLNQISEDDFKKQFPKYRFIFHKTSVSEYGNSQKSRVRLVIVAIKKGIASKYLGHFDKIYKVRSLMTTRELMRGLNGDDEALFDLREDEDTVVCMEKDGIKLNLRQIEDIWLGDYKEYYRWPMPGTKMKTLPGVYRNKADDYPFTARKQNRQFNFDGKMLTPRQLARIQGVPDEFKLWYGRDQKLYCINKARATVTKCPPYEIGLWFSECLKKSNILKTYKT